MPWLFALTLFVSAGLLFSVQPMIAKMILPKFGGAPAVWNTCLVFFQASLLAGYGYAHATTRWLGVRRQALLHVPLLLLPAVFLPFAVSPEWVPSADTPPALLLLLLLLATVGLPFFVVSTSAPLLQRWFAGTGHASARDPYFLYAASNLGSMLALLSYPALIEPNLHLASQGWWWAAGYALLVLLTLACAGAVWRSAASAPAASAAADHRAAAAKAPTLGRRLRWVALAFVPSSLLMGVTTYLSTDIAAIPLIWIVPLALYLLTFILVFSRLPGWLHTGLAWALPPLVLLQLFLVNVPTGLPITALIPLHLATFFVAAMVCHGELARSRPDAEHLTEFYLWMSAGGVLGGFFNAMLAPLVFTDVMEYYLAMVLACLLMPALGSGPAAPGSCRRDLVRPLLLGALTAGLLLVLHNWRAELFLALAARRLPGGVSIDGVRAGLQFGIPCLLCLAFVRRPIRCGLGMGVILLAGSLHQAYFSQVQFAERNFFGILRVATSPDGRFRALTHGTTLHGAQHIRPDARTVALGLSPLAATDPTGAILALAVGRQAWLDYRDEPLTYYYPTGPIGLVFGEFQGARAKPHVGLIGLGVGSLAHYGQPGQKLTFYEIDPAVPRVARDPRWFTYLHDCRAEWDVVLGDARLSLADAPDGHYDLLVLDAFSSDAIPMHLLTVEALDLYLRKLAPGGVLALHITNRFLDLEPVVAALARHRRLSGRVSDDQITVAEAGRGKARSRWVILARQEQDLGGLAYHPRWRSFAPSDGPLWTDDFSNLFRTVRWR